MMAPNGSINHCPRTIIFLSTSLVALVGNREPVLFCESQDEYKYDDIVFKMMFPEFKVIPACRMRCRYCQSKSIFNCRPPTKSIWNNWLRLQGSKLFRRAGNRWYLSFAILWNREFSFLRGNHNRCDCNVQSWQRECIRKSQVCAKKRFHLKKRAMDYQKDCISFERNILHRENYEAKRFSGIKSGIHIF